MEVRQKQWKAWLYLAPALILMIIFTFYPLINTVLVAFTEDYNFAWSVEDGGGNFLTRIFQAGDWGSFSLKNFKILLVRDEVLNPDMDFINIYLKNTLLIAVISVPVSLILSLLIAVALNSIPKFQKVLQTIFFLPYVTNTIAIGMVFAVMFDTNSGLINTLIEMFGGDPVEWLGSAAGTASYWHCMFVVLVYIIWDALPFKILILLSGLQSIDKQYYQAAQIDGTSKFRTLTRITAPLLSPQIIYLMITSFIGAFKEYNSIVAIIGPTATPYGYQSPIMGTVVWYLYQNIKGGKDGFGMGYAAAGSLLLFIIIMIITAINSRISKKFVHY